MTATEIEVQAKPVVKEHGGDEINILWIDDEIEFLKPHILFLKDKGFTVRCVNNGLDGISEFARTRFDVVFLDENMPGLSGIETLERVKQIDDGVPVVMITKTEEETIIRDAINGRIADFLVKPVSMNQVFASLKKVLDGKRIPADNSAQWTSIYDRKNGL